MAAFDPDEYLRQFDRRLLATSEGRRRITLLDPLAFALIYHRDALRSDDTGGRITLSQFHLDIAWRARQWARKGLGIGEVREAWVAPRGSGKSTWDFQILPTWALAHGHRKFVAGFTDHASQAQNHLATFKRKVQGDELLRKDFPSLCRPARRPSGVTDSDRQDLYLAANGAIFSGKGIESTTLGLKVGDQRPDLLLFDDIEPTGALYSAYQKEQRLATIREAIFPMSLNAVVQFVGTVTMEGSIMHDIVRAETEGVTDDTNAWVEAERIETRYYPALMPQDDGSEASLWPGRWSTEELERLRRETPREFSLNYMNEPVPTESAYWSREMFRYGVTAAPTKFIISIDPAVTTARSADYTGIAVLSYSDSEGVAVLHHAEQVKLPPNELRVHVLKLVERWGSRMLLVESNQGGDLWAAVFHDMPVPVQTLHQTVKKEMRWASSVDFWSRGWVLHDPGGSVGPFERQAIAVPRTPNDDVTDAVTSGVTWLLAPRLRRPRRQDKVRAYAS